MEIRMQVSIEYGKNGKDKVRVKIESRDLWQGDVALARIIYPFLKKYRNLYNGKNPMRGYPMAFSPDPCEPEGPENPDRFDEWLICLDKMVYSFEWIAKKKDLCGPDEKNFGKECDARRKMYRKELKELRIQDRERFRVAKPNSALNSLRMDKEFEIMDPVIEKYRKKIEEHR